MERINARTIEDDMADATLDELDELESLVPKPCQRSLAYLRIHHSCMCEKKPPGRLDRSGHRPPERLLSWNLRLSKAQPDYNE